MSVKKTTAAFNDCYLVMDKMLRRGGGVATFPTPQRATVFRHRCYRARNLLYKASELSTPRGQIPSTPYDDIYIRHFPGDNFLTFCLRSKDPLPDLSFEDEVPPPEALDLDF